MISGLLVAALLPVDARNMAQCGRLGGVVAALAGGCAGVRVDGDGFLAIACQWPGNGTRWRPAR